MGLADGSYWVYQYDQLGQVISGRRFWADGTPVAGQQFEYGFDDIGNRTSTGGRESALSDYTVNALNQYTERDVAGKIDVFGIANPTADVTVESVDADRHGEYFHRVVTVSNGSAAQYPQIDVVSEYGSTQTSSGGGFVAKSPEPYTHDTDGNLTQDGRWDFVWDGENRLAKMRSRSGSPAPERRIEFEYDSQGRRIRKKVFNDRDDGQGSELSDTVCLYDGWNLVAELNANSSNAKIRTYVWGNDLSGSMQGAGGVGGLLKVVNHGDSSQHFVAYDGNGNVMGLVQDGNGSVSARYEYGPFAEPLRASGAQAAIPFRFSTKYCDVESGLYYYGYRYYDPGTGRWPSRDPIAEIGGPNLHVFVDNDPIAQAELLGMMTNTKCEELKDLNKARKLSKKIDRVLKYLESRKDKPACGIPEIKCTECEHKDHGEKWAIRGTYQTSSMAVTINQNHIPNAKVFLEVLFHELIHAKQGCDKGRGPKDCEESACNEIQAYLDDGGACKEYKGAQFKECIIQRAAASAKQHCDGKLSDALKAVRRMYPKCGKSVWED